MDTARTSAAFKLTGLLFLVFCASAFPQTLSPRQTDAAAARQLAEQEQWEELLRQYPDSARSSDELPVDVQLYRGIALARLGRLEEATRVLAAGAEKAPTDKRFPIELAGIAYKERLFPEAKSRLSDSLALDPEDSYANDFLASIYFQEGNTEAALKYWNRVGKPRLSDLSYEPVPRVKPVLLDRTFKFSLGQMWTVDQLLAAQQRLRNLQIFTNIRQTLRAHPDGNFDLVFAARERNGWGNSTAAGLLSLFRGLPVLTVTPEFSNLGHAAINWYSLYRWDAQKRRVYSEYSMPLNNNPALRGRLYFDARDENWDITRSFLAPIVPATGFNMQRMEAGAELASVPDGLWRWTNRVFYSYRQYRNLAALPASASGFFENDSAIHDRFEISRSLYRLPERRLTVQAGASAQFGSHFGSTLGANSALGEFLGLRWLPRATGDDVELEALLRAGQGFGRLSFDELSILGVDRDSPLWLRGHANLRGNRKGNAPMGRNYVLSNLTYMTRIFRHRFVTLRAGPFFDAGHITDSSGLFGSRNVQLDTGIELRVRAFGNIELTFGYGRGLRSGKDTLYATQAGFANFRGPD